MKKNIKFLILGILLAVYAVCRIIKIIPSEWDVVLIVLVLFFYGWYLYFIYPR